MSHKAYIALVAAVTTASVATAGEAGAATPKTGTFHGVTSQKDTRLAYPAVALEVEKRGGVARVASADVHLTLECEDGTSIVRSVHMPGSKLSSGGRFRLAETSGGYYGPHGQISVSVVMNGRFTSRSVASGTFTAGATVSESTTTPAVSCWTGPVAWTSAR